jgi:hypothetical protein
VRLDYLSLERFQGGLVRIFLSVHLRGTQPPHIEVAAQIKQCAHEFDEDRTIINMEITMKAMMHTPTTLDVLRHAKPWRVRMTRQQAKSFLDTRADKINKAMQEAADEVIRSEVENMGLEWEDKELA